MNKLMAITAVVLCLGLGACNEDKEVQYVTVGQPCDEDPYTGGQRNPVYLYNYAFFGMAVRWADGYVFVRLADDNEVDRAVLGGICGDLNQLIGPNCLFVVLPWYDPTPAHIVVYKYSLQAEFNGSVTVRAPVVSSELPLGAPINSNGTWRSMQIHVGPSNAVPSQQWNLVKRELIHALGFCGFTKCGGVMNADPQDGVITPMVRDFLVGLYSVPPGTYVGP